MKAIDNIITKLKKGDDITHEERVIVGYLLEECRRIEKSKGKNCIVEMSPQMFRWFINNAYTAKGEYSKAVTTFKVKSFNLE